jgi:hypothetical protein
MIDLLSPAILARLQKLDVEHTPLFMPTVLVKVTASRVFKVKKTGFHRFTAFGPGGAGALLIGDGSATGGGAGGFLEKIAWLKEGDEVEIVIGARAAQDTVNYATDTPPFCKDGNSGGDTIIVLPGYDQPLIAGGGKGGKAVFNSDGWSELPGGEGGQATGGDTNIPGGRGGSVLYPAVSGRTYATGGGARGNFLSDSRGGDIKTPGTQTYAATGGGGAAPRAYGATEANNNSATYSIDLLSAAAITPGGGPFIGLSAANNAATSYIAGEGGALGSSSQQNYRNVGYAYARNITTSFIDLLSGSMTFTASGDYPINNIYGYAGSPGYTGQSSYGSTSKNVVGFDGPYGYVYGMGGTGGCVTSSDYSTYATYSGSPDFCAGSGAIVRYGTPGASTQIKMGLPGAGLVFIEM